MENYQAYQCCYHRYVSQFKQFFHLASCRMFEESAEKNSGSVSSYTIPSTQYLQKNLLLPPLQKLNMIFLNRHQRKHCKEAALINAQKIFFYEFETYPQPSAWLNVKSAIDVHGPFKILFSAILSLLHLHACSTQYQTTIQWIVQ